VDSALPADGRSQTEESIPSLVRYYMGWLAVIGAIGHLPALVTAVRVMPILSNIGWILLGFSLPATLLLLVGGIGLIYRKVFGFYLVCIAVLFGGIGGLSAPIIPFLKRLLQGSYYGEDVTLLSNLALLAVLVCCQLLTLSGPRRRLHLYATSALVLLGAAHVGVVRAMVDRERGTAGDIEATPYIGETLQTLRCTGPIHYRLVYTKWQRSLTCVLSGRTTEQNVQDFAAANGLKAVPNERRHKLLPQTKGWKLNPELFPVKFSADDACFVGRLKTYPRAVLQLGFKKSDGRVVAEVFGFLASNTNRRRESVTTKTNSSEAPSARE
jgi:hypothetical protein